MESTRKDVKSRQNWKWNTVSALKFVNAEEKGPPKIMSKTLRASVVNSRPLKKMGMAWHAEVIDP